jgi:hypothetical protein
MPVRTLVACAVLTWRVSVFLKSPSGLHYWLLVAQIGIALIYVGVTLGGYGRMAARYR